MKWLSAACMYGPMAPYSELLCSIITVLDNGEHKKSRSQGTSPGALPVGTALAERAATLAYLDKQIAADCILAARSLTRLKMDLQAGKHRPAGVPVE